MSAMKWFLAVLLKSGAFGIVFKNKDPENCT